MPTEEQQLHSNSRGRSSGGRLMSNLRSRSRSRAASKQRRSASAQPERRPSTTTNNVSSKLAEAKKRRSASRPAERSSSSSSSSKLLKKKTSSKSSSSKSRSKSRTATASTTTRTRSKSAAPPRPQPQPRIINLVDVVDVEQEEDDMLDALLNPAASPGGATAALAAQYDPTRDSPKSVGRFPDAATANNNNKNKMAAYSSEEDEESSDDDSDEEDEEVDARDLLAQVNARMEQQRLMEDAKQLRATIEQKDTEIEQLTGQLRMAISTKCDLVIAHTELERLHESDMERRKHYADEVKRHNLYLQEVRAEVELEFMNELTQLATKVAETEERRQQEVTEKDLTIKLLEQKIYRMEKNALQGSSARPDNDKVKFYKKRLGVVADQ